MGKFVKTVSNLISIAFKWIGILTVLIVAISLLSVWLIPDSEEESVSTQSTTTPTPTQSTATPTPPTPTQSTATPTPTQPTSVQASTPTNETEGFTVITDPEGVQMLFEWSQAGDGDRTVASSPLTLYVAEGSEVTYTASRDVDEGLSGSTGTFLAPAPNETVSIWLDRLTPEELASIERDRAEERARVERERIVGALEGKRGEVGVTCKDIVRGNLRAPSTAEFGGIFSGRVDYRIDASNSTLYYINTVDAQNGFGAVLRYNFICEYSLDTDTVRLISFEQ